MYALGCNSGVGESPRLYRRHGRGRCRSWCESFWCLWVPCEGVGVLHVLVDDPEGAANAFESAGLTVRGQREVLVVGVENEPGALGSLTRRFADAGVNVDLVYVAADHRLVLGVDDLEAGRALV